MQALKISALTATSALGSGLQAHWNALQQERSGLRFRAEAGIETWVGEVSGLDQPITGALALRDSRNNRLIEKTLQQDGFDSAMAALLARHGAERIGVFVGTSTASIDETERAYRERAPAPDGSEARLPAWFRHRHTQSVHAPAEYLQLRYGLRGVCLGISTACSSSAKVFASAARAIEAGLCDAALVGGADSLCQTTLHGFHALQLVSAQPCRPADRQRDGISLGEAAGFAILERADGDDSALLLGYGESSDAHHMSAPDPQGAGARAAMLAACRRGGIAPAQVDYINLHGTATPANDAAEDCAVHSVFGSAVACSSTKGWTGHTLGAAGIVEAALSLLCLRHGWVPRSLNTDDPDPALAVRVLTASRQQTLQRVLSNSFGFGGSNCSLLFGAAQCA